MKNIRNLTTILFGITTGIIVDFVGRLMLSEVIALVSVPFLNLRKLFKKLPDLKWVSICLLVFLLSQIVSDIVNKTAFNDYIRGWAMIFFAFISTLYFVSIINQNFKNIVFLLIGFFLIKLLLGEGELNIDILEENTNYLKVRFVGFLNPLILLLTYVMYRKKLKWSILGVLIIYGIVNLILDARSNGLTFLISGIIYFLFLKRVLFKKSNLLIVLSITLPLLYMLYVYYVDLVLTESIGGSNAISQLSMAKNPYNPFELLYFGRIDFFVLVEAIKDKIIFGHGSWGKDPSGYYAHVADSLSGNKFSSLGGGTFIRAHSILLGSWAYSGIVGFLAIGVLFFKLFKDVWFILKYNLTNPYLIIIIVLSVSMVWDLFFSPLGQLRTNFPFFAAVIIVAKFHLNEILSLSYDRR